MTLFRLLRRPDFSRFWLSTSASLLGSNVAGFALPTIAVAALGGSAAQIAGITIVQTLAYPVLGMFVAAAVERANKPRLVALTDMGRALATFAVVVLALCGHLSIGLITAACAVTAVLGVFRDVGAQALLPALLSKEEIGHGNAALELSNTASMSAGPAIAGLLTSTIGAPFALLIDSVGYLVSACSLRGLRATTAAPARTEQAPFWDELTAGVRWIWNAPKLLRIAGCTATVNLAASAAQTVSLIFFYRVLHLTPLTLGILLAASNAGLVGAWLAPRLQRRFGIIAVLGIAIAISSIGRFVLPLSSVTQLPAIVAGFAYVTISIVSTLYNIVQSTYRQQITPLALQARMHAAMRTINSSTVPLGAALGGLLAGIAGPTTTLTVCAAVAACAGAWLVAPSARTRREEIEHVGFTLTVNAAP